MTTMCRHQTKLSKVFLDKFIFFYIVSISMRVNRIKSVFMCNIIVQLLHRQNNPLHNFKKCVFSQMGIKAQGGNNAV